MATQIQLVLALGVTVREEPIQMALHVFRQVFTVIRKNLKNTSRSHTQKKIQELSPKIHTYILYIYIYIYRKGITLKNNYV